MRQVSESDTMPLAVVAVTPCFLSSASSHVRAAAPEPKPPVVSPGHFVGKRECAGKFDLSGQTIEAHQQFAPELDGAWIAFRHDDNPPFGYHALAEWRRDPQQKRFVMIALDSPGGARLFPSGGWEALRLQWDRDARGGTSVPNQRFSFERLEDRPFRLSCFTKKSGEWSRVDTSTCSKQ